MKAGHKIDYSSFSKGKCLVQIKLLKIEIPKELFKKSEKELELVIYTSYKTIRENGTYGPIISGVEPQLTPYFKINEPITNINTPIFQGPIVLEDPYLEMKFSILEINGIDESDQKKIQNIYDEFSSTSQLAVDKQLITSATTISQLSYLPFIWPIWVSIVKIINAIDTHKPLTQSPFTLLLDGSFGYRPKDKDINPNSEFKKNIEFTEDPNSYEIDKNEKTNKSGQIKTLIYSFSTNPIGTEKLKLHLEVQSSLINTNKKDK